MWVDQFQETDVITVLDGYGEAACTGAGGTVTSMARVQSRARLVFTVLVPWWNGRARVALRELQGTYPGGRIPESGTN